MALILRIVRAGLAAALVAGVAGFVLERSRFGTSDDAAVARANDSDIVLMAAAVADYRPDAQLDEKRPKDGNPWQVTLAPTDDILSDLSARRENGQVLVGFAADRGEPGLARAREKLNRKRVDLVVYNDVSRDDIGFDADENEVVVIDGSGEQKLAKAPKGAIAAAIVDRAEKLLRERG